MSSTGIATSSTASYASNFQSILNSALVDYSKITGIDLSQNLFASQIAKANSPDGILQLLQEQAKAFKEVRDGNQRLTKLLDPIVNVLHSFSMSLPPANVVFVGMANLFSAGAASGVTSSYDALVELFECFANFLGRLEIYTTIPLSLPMYDLIVRIIVQLLLVLALVTKKFKEGRFKKATKKLFGEGEREIDDALQKLDRLTQEEVRMAVAHTLGVVYGLVDNVNRLMEESRTSMDLLQRETNDILKKRDNMKNVQLRDVQHWLDAPNPSTNHNTFWSARHQGTATWLFENKLFIGWKTTGSLLWIHGKPGSGKSTLLSAIIEDIQGVCAAGLASMAYYYFDFHDAKKQDRYSLLSSLLFQLSAKSNAYYGVLSRLYADNAGGTTIPTHDALLKCLKDMLSLPVHAPIFIIVDALDECPNFSTQTLSAREEVLDLIEELVQLALPGLHLCVASRPEIDIRKVLGPLTDLQISLHDETGQKRDINDYINAVVHSDRRMRRWRKEDQNLVVDELSKYADGSFRWVICQVHTLCLSFPFSIRSVLADLPPSLDETYEKALLGINREKRGYARRLYQCLMVSIRPLRLEELADVLPIRFDKAASHVSNAAWHPENAEEAEEVVMSACSNLIAIVESGGHQVVQFSHFSVKEYLTSKRLSTAEERLSYYHILPEPAHTILAQASLSVLVQLNDKIDRNIIRRIPLALYAARHWVDHAQLGHMPSDLRELMERLFDPSKPHFSAWVWLYDVDRDWIKPMSEERPTRPEAVPLYYASLCGLHDLVKYLLVAHPQDVNAMGGHHVTSLHAALDKGHMKVAQLLLQHGADVNARDGKDRTPLHIAAEYGDIKAIQSLIDHGADTNAENSDKIVPLTLASRRGRLGAAQLLLDHGADVGHRDSIGQTPMHEALDNGHVDIIRLLLEHGADANAQGRRLRVPLHLAADRGDLELSQLLLEHGAEVDARDKMDWTPLHIASEHGDTEILRFLIDRGANLDARNKDQETPLFLASRKGKLDAARLLSEHRIDVNSQDLLGRTPLHVAAEGRHYDIVHLLYNQGADLDAPDRDLWTPLHLTAGQGKVAVAELLLECGADIDARDKEDGTPLHVASEQGHLDLVRLLLEHRADVLALNHDDHTFLDVAWARGHRGIVDINARYEGGQTALHIAAHHGDPEFMRWLIDRKVDPLDPHAEDNDQETPLFPASRNGKLEATRLLLEAGANPNHGDWQEMTPLHGASENGHVAVARLLLDHNAAVNAEHVYRWTPLHLASQTGKGESAEVLLRRGAMVNATNDSGWTPLHLASQKGHLDVVELLLANDADVNLQTEDGETALHLAAFYNHLKVVQVLVKNDANLRMKNKEGKTALVLASKEGHFDLAQLLRQTALIRESGGEQVLEQQVGERRVIAE